MKLLFYVLIDLNFLVRCVFEYDIGKFFMVENYVV